jgi:N-acetylneuraminic acid mutarotase
VSGQFQRLNLAAPGAWEQLPGGPHLQGMNLAAYGGKIYRIGGMQPHNAPGQPADTVSVSDSARFDPALMLWEALPALPEPRSSHDFVVVGSKLIVSGGWALQGKAGQKWMDTLQVMDLSKSPLTWKSAAQPFKRRALIAAAYNGKMYVMGGMTDTNVIVPDVDIYDPQSGTWTKGPALPGKALNSFAPAATVHEGKLYVSLGDGSLYRLNEAAQRWEEAGSATPRVAHRLVSGGKSILVMGGAAGGKNFDLIEVLDR